MFFALKNDQKVIKFWKLLDICIQDQKQNGGKFIIILLLSIAGAQSLNTNLNRKPKNIRNLQHRKKKT